MHTWGDPELYQIWTLNQVNKNDWPKETWKKCPIKLPPGHDSVFLLSPSMCLPTCTTYYILSFLLMNTLLVSLLSVSMWKFISIQLMGQGLVSGLGFRALTVMAWLQSVAGNRNPASNHCCPRPSEISLTVLTRKLLPNVKEELIMEVWCLFESESEEEGGLLPQLPLFLWL